MSSLSPDLYDRLIAVLRKCSAFDSDENLRALFAPDDLKPFQDNLPDSSPDKVSRITRFIEYMQDEKHVEKGSVLPLFLLHLSKLHSVGTNIRDELDHIYFDVCKDLGLIISPQIVQISNSLSDRGTILMNSTEPLQGLLDQCRQTLLICSEVQSNDRLRTLFSSPKIKVFQTHLQEEVELTGRVDSLLAYLQEHNNNQGESALALFLEVLALKYPQGHKLHEVISSLAEQFHNILDEKFSKPFPDGGIHPPGIIASSSRGPQSYRELLQSLSQYIELKFHMTYTADELGPSDIQKFVVALNGLKVELMSISELSQFDQEALEKIDLILDQCYVAKSFFMETDKREQFFTKLRIIAVLVKYL